jgi:hypothetical protein
MLPAGCARVSSLGPAAAQSAPGGRPLEDPEPPCPRAVALASFLVSDPFSPASQLFNDPDDPFSSSDRATTAQLARAALEAIDHRPLR